MTVRHDAANGGVEVHGVGLSVGLVHRLNVDQGAWPRARDARCRQMVEGARAPVVAFTREGLPQYTRLAASLRSVADNVNQLVSSLRRNPSSILSGPKTPEFRR